MEHSPCVHHKLCHQLMTCVLPGCSQRVGMSPCAIPKGDPMYCIATGDCPDDCAIKKLALTIDDPECRLICEGCHHKSE